MSEQPNKPPFPAGRELVKCVKCDADNMAGASKCHECGSHLYRVCPNCGRSNARTRRHCIACSARIGRTTWQRLRDKVVRRASPWTIGAVIVGLAVLTKLVLMLVNVHVNPAPEEPSEPIYSETVNHGGSQPSSTNP